MTYTIEEMPRSHVAFMRRVGPYGADNYAIMGKLKEWAQANGLFTKSAVILGISQDNPETTPPENCRYDVCIVVADDCTITSGDVNKAALPGGRYAVFTIKHTAEAVKRAWEEIFTQLSAQGHHPDFSRPVLERYIPALIEKHLCEICIPV
ncbi:DNA gyrase inhibitor GyrI [Anaerobacterium chartisolvens]|uniref:DNA gyrase inhibitor GyrI n=1 Tax=Anaerobacterium chartisolvens TaxID=1297424 RepID=A0A369AJT2_9FIRM|nr:GyrI-like domain-containing protein [Anaerobacterium chartisolvens]RCX09353.1 DNA gyrase inhibitor GyrI [Anaerobacterium chartisolvens]